MDETLAAAIAMHQSGRLGPAAELYQKVLARDASNAAALHLLGVLHHQQGDHARAAELISRAVALQPNAPAFHANLGEVYRSLGQIERAVGCCRAALALRPDFPEALSNLGLALQALGRRAEAIDQFRRALELSPRFAPAHNNLGIVLRESGQLDEALDHFRRAVELDPTFAPARTNLGQMLLDRGKAEEALVHCQEAVALQPDVAAYRHNLGNALRALDRLVEARSSYLEALRLAPDLAQPHLQMGLALRREGKLPDALHWLRRAVELEPENAGAWEALAELQVEREEFAEAITCWERALALVEKDRADLHLSLGWSLQEEGRLAEAGEHYRKALALDASSALPRINIGGLHEEWGQLEEAESAFRTALELQPNYALPHARLATLLRGKLPDADLAALEVRLADPALDPEPRSHLLFALAQVLDARGQYAGAAESSRQANALRLELARGRREYVPADHENFVDRLVRFFDRETFDRTAGMGLDTPEPVFILGLPRSGTTLIEQILASHPRIFGAGELRLARQSLESIPELLGRSEVPMECIPHLDAPAIRRLAEKHLADLRTHDPGQAAGIVDKMPDNYQYLGLLAVLFPKATFIHCRRDLRDVAVSCWMTDFRSIRWSHDPEHIGSRFRQYLRLMDHWRSVLPVRLHELEYEETVADLESVARRLVAACRLEWDPACLEFHKTSRPVRTASITQVRQPLYRQSVGRWKNYEPYLADLFAALPLR
jgi:tetratricopeptide (TPR) repeat protein